MAEIEKPKRHGLKLGKILASPPVRITKRRRNSVGSPSHGDESAAPEKSPSRSPRDKENKASKKKTEKSQQKDGKPPVKRNFSGPLGMLRNRLFSPTKAKTEAPLTPLQNSKQGTSNYTVAYQGSAGFQTPKGQSTLRPPSNSDLSTQGTQSVRTATPVMSSPNMLSLPSPDHMTVNSDSQQEVRVELPPNGGNMVMEKGKDKGRGASEMKSRRNASKNLNSISPPLTQPRPGMFDKSKSVSLSQRLRIGKQMMESTKTPYQSKDSGMELKPTDRKEQSKSPATHTRKGRSHSTRSKSPTKDDRRHGRHKRTGESKEESGRRRSREPETQRGRRSPNRQVVSPEKGREMHRHRRRTEDVKRRRSNSADTVPDGKQNDTVVQGRLPRRRSKSEERDPSSAGVHEVNGSGSKVDASRKSRHVQRHYSTDGEELIEITKVHIPLSPPRKINATDRVRLSELKDQLAMSDTLPVGLPLDKSESASRSNNQTAVLQSKDAAELSNSRQHKRRGFAARQETIRARRRSESPEKMRRGHTETSQPPGTKSSEKDNLRGVHRCHSDTAADRYEKTVPKRRRERNAKTPKTPSGKSKPKIEEFHSINLTPAHYAAVNKMATRDFASPLLATGTDNASEPDVTGSQKIVSKAADLKNHLRKLEAENRLNAASRRGSQTESVDTRSRTSFNHSIRSNDLTVSSRLERTSRPPRRRRES